MPRAVLNIELCQPPKCYQGVCLARKECPVKALWQEEPYAVPYLSGERCHGCSKCVVVCPLKAIYLS